MNNELKGYMNELLDICEEINIEVKEYDKSFFDKAYSLLIKIDKIMIQVNNESFDTYRAIYLDYEIDEQVRIFSALWSFRLFSMNIEEDKLVNSISIKWRIFFMIQFAFIFIHLHTSS